MAKKAQVTSSKEREAQERKDLETALRLIRLRCDGLDAQDLNATGATFGIYFTASQLFMLNRLAQVWNKVAAELLKHK